MKISLESDICYVTEQAALACIPLIGKEDQYAIDKVATEAMRRALKEVEINAKIVIGEGERDKAPMLYIGEEFGSRYEYDIAVDPLEGTQAASKGEQGSYSVMAVAPKNTLLHAPDIYMYKIAAPVSGEQILDLDETITENLDRIINNMNIKPKELKVVLLNRPRHTEMIEEVIKFGSKIELIENGDVFGIIESIINPTPQMYLGIGGAPEGVLAACALKTYGGQMCTKLVFRNEEEKEYAAKLGIKDYNKKYHVSDLVKKDAIFVATGITGGNLISGIEKSPLVVKSIILNSTFTSIKFINHYV